MFVEFVSYSLPGSELPGLVLVLARIAPDVGIYLGHLWATYRKQKAGQDDGDYLSHVS